MVPKSHTSIKVTQKRPQTTAAQSFDQLPQLISPSSILQRAKLNSQTLSPRDVRRLQRTIGNHAVNQLLIGSVIKRQPEPDSEGCCQAASIQRQLTAAIAVRTSMLSTSPKWFRQQTQAKGSLQIQPLFTTPRISTIAQDKSAGGSSQAPRQVKTHTLPGGTTIQRFNAMADNPYVPTRDQHHPAIVNAGGLNAMGPYKFYPMQGKFEYQPPQIGGGVQNFLNRLRRHKKAGANYRYPAENIAPVANGYLWTSPKTHANINFHPKGLQPADYKDRVEKATHLYKTEKSGNVVVGKVLDGLRAHNQGNTPRAFVSVATEDGYGAAQHAHTGARHVIGGADVPNADAVAARAAFGILGGIAHGAVRGVYTPIATAFKTANDANQDIGAAVTGELTNNWPQHRMTILTQGVLDLNTARGGGNVVAYETAKAGGGSWPITEKPTYLVPGSKGQKPMFYPDPRWDAWTRPGGPRGVFQWIGSFFSSRARFSNAEINALKANPLTTDKSANVPNINVRILASEALAHGGWFIHSAYPTY